MGFTPKFCIRSISPEPFEKFSLNFGQMFISVRRCAETNESVMQTQGKGHTSRSWNLLFNFVFAPYLLSPLKEFN